MFYETQYKRSQAMNNNKNWFFSAVSNVNLKSDKHFKKNMGNEIICNDKLSTKNNGKKSDLETTIVGGGRGDLSI